MTLDFHQIDAFTCDPYAGNPAAVVVLEAGDARDDAWLQRVAAEMNLSETAFVWWSGENGSHPLRWFTPRVEVDLCGHATLATAHALWSSALAAASELAFETRSGTLQALRKDDGRIALDFPARVVSPKQPPSELIEALGIQPLGCYKTGEGDWLIELATPSDVVALEPDFPLLAQVPCRGVAVTARGDLPDRCAGSDFVSRFFAPAVGIDEDPVTGSAHCALGPFWAPRLKKSSMSAYQASPRGGAVDVTLDEESGRVLLQGHAVTVVTGTLVG